MCDYSLMTIPNRLATDGENLVAHRFSTGTLGFASVSDLRDAEDSLRNRPRRGFWRTLWEDFFGSSRASKVPAVCIPPGARLLLHDVSARLQQELEVGQVEKVVFTEVTAQANSYRDAILFKNGRHILVQKLNEGQRAKVLDLSSAEAEEPSEGWLVSEPLDRS
jgi:hypothetical protein